MYQSSQYNHPLPSFNQELDQTKNTSRNSIKICTEQKNPEKDLAKLNKFNKETVRELAQKAYDDIKKINGNSHVNVDTEQYEIIMDSLCCDRKLLDSINKINIGLKTFHTYIYCVKEKTIDTKDISSNDDNLSLNFINGLYHLLGYKTQLQISHALAGDFGCSSSAHYALIISK